jgi:hypothetical protein
MGYIPSKKVEYRGHTFDSQTEFDFYMHLMKQDDVIDIVLQPQYTLVEPFEVECKRCVNGKLPSPKTGNLVKCKTCKGTGYRNRQAWTYRPDFKVTYENGKVDVIDVKGRANESFRLVRKMFEYTQGIELLVAKKVKGGWWKYV